MKMSKIEDKKKLEISIKRQKNKNPNCENGVQETIDPAASKSEYFPGKLKEIDINKIDKNALLDDPELLAQLYKIAEKEDLELAEMGLEQYIAALEEEDKVA
jgi:hypothetical protein